MFAIRGIGPRLYRDPMTLTLIAAGGSLYQGYSANQAAGAEAKLQRQQGETALAEAKTNADQAAWNYTQDTQKQSTAFQASGVTMEGSPSAVVKNTAAQGQLQVQSILNRGYADYTLANQQASITENKGRAALIGGMVQAGSGVGSAAYKGYLGQNTNPLTTTGGDSDWLYSGQGVN